VTTMINRDTLETLAGVEESPAISLFMPRPNRRRSSRRVRARVGSLFAEAKDRAVAAGQSREAAEALLAPARELLSNGVAWDEQAKSLAIFVSPSTLVINQVHRKTGRFVHVSDRFDIRPLLGADSAATNSRRARDTA
jgi:hypothetical protein